MRGKRGVVEKKNTSWKNDEQFLREMWEYFTLQRTEVVEILEDAAREKRGNRNVPSERFWSRPEEIAEMGCGMAAWKSSKKDAEKKRSPQNGFSGKYSKIMRKWRERKLDVWVLCRKS